MLLSRRNRRRRGVSIRSTGLSTLVTLLTGLLLAAPAGVATEGTGFAYDPDTGQVVGEFVSFRFDNVTGTITDYTVRAEEAEGGVTVFGEVTIESFSEDGRAGTPLSFLPTLETGDVFRALGDHAAIWAMDRSGGPLAIANLGRLAAIDFPVEVGTVEGMERLLPFPEANNTVTYILGPDLAATLETAESAEGDFVNISGEGFRGYLFAAGGYLSIEASSVVAKLQGPSATFFLGWPLGDRLEDPTLELELARGAAEGHIGARLDVGPEHPEGARLILTAFRAGFQARLQSALKDRVVLDIESSEAEGTLVVVEIHEDLLDLQREIRITLDGEVLSQAAGLEDLIAAKNAGVSVASVYLRETPDSLLLVVYVPHFSTRTLAVETIAPATGPGELLAQSASLIATAAAVTLVLIAAIIALRRRGSPPSNPDPRTRRRGRPGVRSPPPPPCSRIRPP